MSRIGEYATECGNQESTAQVVGQHMVVVRPPQEGTVPRARQDFGEDSEAIEIGDDAREGDGCPLAMGQPGDASHCPAQEQMGDRMHGVTSLSCYMPVLVHALRFLLGER